MGLASFLYTDHTVCELKSFSVKDRFEQQLFELFPWYRCLPDTKPHKVRAKSIRQLLFHTSTHVFHTSTIPYYPHTSRNHVFLLLFLFCFLTHLFTWYLKPMKPPRPYLGEIQVTQSQVDMFCTSRHTTIHAWKCIGKNKAEWLQRRKWKRQNSRQRTEHVKLFYSLLQT